MRTTSRPAPHPSLNQQDAAANPGFLFRRLQQASSSNFINALAAYQLTPIQYTILRVVGEHAGIDQRTVATHAALDASTTADVLRRLAARKLVTRTPDPVDKRARIVRLTRTGRHLLTIAAPIVKEARRELLAPLSPARQKALFKAIVDLLAAYDGTYENHEQASVADTPGPWRRLK